MTDTRRCKHCDTIIAADEKDCPHCGKTGRLGFASKAVLSILGLVVAVTVTTGIDNRSDKGKPVSGSAQKKSPEEVFSGFSKMVETADGRLKECRAAMTFIPA